MNLSPRPVPTLQTHLEAQIGTSEAFFWHRLRWRLVAQLLPRDEPFDLLDVGAGAGLSFRYLTREFPQARYLFIEPLAFLEARLEHMAGRERNLGGAAAFPGVRMVTVLDVLEHIEDDGAFLGDLVEKMDPAARLVITVPALPSLWSQWDDTLGHHRRYTKSTLGRLLSTCALRVDEVSYLFPEMLPAALFRRLAPRPGRQASGEFPVLPSWLNETLYVTGVISQSMRRLAPAGTSLVATAVRR